jgi:putative component of membrane protein insertase Oxa1/YidC/SpoIIIJ protein YidD
LAWLEILLKSPRFSPIKQVLISNPLRYGTVLAINAYQRYMSPYKGFTCAHRHLYKGDSCSQYVKRIVVEESLEGAWIAIRERFQECREANLILRNSGSNSEWGVQPKKRRKPQDCNSSNWGDCCQGLSCGDCGSPNTQGLDCNPCDGDGCSFDCGGVDCGSCGS